MNLSGKKTYLSSGAFLASLIAALIALTIALPTKAVAANQATYSLSFEEGEGIAGVSTSWGGESLDKVLAGAKFFVIVDLKPGYALNSASLTDAEVRGQISGLAIHDRYAMFDFVMPPHSVRLTLSATPDKTQRKDLTVTCILDERELTSTEGIASFSFVTSYANGDTSTSSNLSSFSTVLPTGTSWKITNVKAKSGFVFDSVASKVAGIAGEKPTLVFKRTEAAPVDMTEAKVKFPKASYSYTGENIEPIPTVSVAGKKLIANVDYSWSYEAGEDFMQPGSSVNVRVTGLGKYVGEAMGSFKIGKASLSKATMQLDEADGLARTSTPHVTLTMHENFVIDGVAQSNDRELVEGSDYTLRYTTSSSGKTVTVKATGKGNYSSTKSRTFTLVLPPVSLEEATVKALTSSKTYTGDPIEVIPTVKLGTKTLKRNVDYTLSYENNTSAGTATILVEGIGSYFGTAKGSFTIAPTKISSAKVTLAATSFTYTGATITPTVTVVGKKSQQLVEGVDYTVAYTNNLKKGTAKVVVTGLGDYTGSTSKTFSIKAASIAGADISYRLTGFTATSKNIKPVPSVKLNGKLLKAGVDYTVTYGSNNTLSKGSIKIKGLGNYTGTASVSW